MLRRQFSATFLALTLLGAQALHAQDTQARNPLRSIAVTGHSEEDVMPDEARLSAYLVFKDKDEKKAIETLETHSRQFIDILAEYNIAQEDIESSGLQMDLQYAPSESGIFQKPDLYIARQNFKIDVKDLDILSEFLPALGEAGAELSPLQFVISNEDELRDELELEALDEAKSRAERLADRANMELGAPISIGRRNIEAATYARAEAEYAMADMAKSGKTEIQVYPEMLTIAANIEVVYELVAP